MAGPSAVPGQSASPLLCCTKAGASTVLHQVRSPLLYLGRGFILCQGGSLCSAMAECPFLCSARTGGFAVPEQGLLLYCSMSGAICCTRGGAFYCTRALTLCSARAECPFLCSARTGPSTFYGTASCQEPSTVLGKGLYSVPGWVPLQGQGRAPFPLQCQGREPLYSAVPRQGALCAKTESLCCLPKNDRSTSLQCHDRDPHALILYLTNYKILF
jgi:hypothetical protein